MVPNCVMAAAVLPVIVIPTRNTPLPILLVGDGICQGHSQALGPADWITMFPDLWDEVASKSKSMRIRMDVDHMSIDFKPLGWQPPHRNGSRA